MKNTIKTSTHSQDWDFSHLEIQKMFDRTKQNHTKTKTDENENDTKKTNIGNAKK